MPVRNGTKVARRGLTSGPAITPELLRDAAEAPFGSLPSLVQARRPSPIAPLAFSPNKGDAAAWLGEVPTELRRGTSIDPKGGPSLALELRRDLAVGPAQPASLGWGQVPLPARPPCPPWPGLCRDSRPPAHRRAGPGRPSGPATSRPRLSAPTGCRRRSVTPGSKKSCFPARPAG